MQVVDQLAVLRLVKVLDVQRLFHLGDAGLGDCDGAVLLVDLVIAHPAAAAGTMAANLYVGVGGLFRGAGDDQRRTGLVDEDAVDLVDDGEVVARAAPGRSSRVAMLSRR